MNTANTRAYSAQSATSPLATATIPRHETTPRDVKIEILFCGKNSIAADVEIIPIQKVNEAYDRVANGDVKYRFTIDTGSLKSEWTELRLERSAQ
jgi:D-arabinose 1-dehydrogenase-like Zn-dependent alcohol dehydrogenase